MNIQYNIVVLDDGETWSAAQGACVVLPAQNPGSQPRTISIDDLVRVWQQQQLLEAAQ